MWTRVFRPAQGIIIIPKEVVKINHYLYIVMSSNLVDAVNQIPLSFFTQSIQSLNDYFFLAANSARPLISLYLLAISSLLPFCYITRTAVTNPLRSITAVRLYRYLVLSFVVISADYDILHNNEVIQ